MRAAFRDRIDAIRLAAGNGVVHDLDLVPRNSVLPHDQTLGVMAHRHHAIRRLKTRALDARHVPVHIVAAPVVLQRVDMRHQRLSRQLRTRMPAG